MDKTQERFDEIFYSPNQITMPFAYIRRKVEKYVCDSLSEQAFDVKFESSVDMVAERVAYTTYSSKTRKELCLYYKAEKFEHKFRERMNFAEAIAFLVLCVVPYQLGDEKNIFTSDDLFYFATKILIHYTAMDNGALLRGNYGLKSKEEVIHNIEKYYPGVSEPSSDKISIINSVFEKLFVDADNKKYEEPICFRCETRIINEYLHAVDLHKEKIKIFIKETDGYGSPRGELRCAKHEDRYIIWHTDVNSMSLYSEREWIGSKITPLNAISVIIAHELGHLALHRHLPEDERKHDSREIAAFQWARCMLETREYRYNEGRVDDLFDDACKTWKEYITLLLDAMGYDKSFISEIYPKKERVTQRFASGARNTLEKKPGKKSTTQ